jgi:hypothetical protein
MSKQQEAKTNAIKLDQLDSTNEEQSVGEVTEEQEGASVPTADVPTAPAVEQAQAEEPKVTVSTATVKPTTAGMVSVTASRAIKFMGVRYPAGATFEVDAQTYEMNPDLQAATTLN